jgi:hypothetical protein
MLKAFSAKYTKLFGVDIILQIGAKEEVRHGLVRTKLQGVTSESLFKDMIAGHARDLANSQTYSLENGGEVCQSYGHSHARFPYF